MANLVFLVFCILTLMFTVNGSREITAHYHTAVDVLAPSTHLYWDNGYYPYLGSLNRLFPDKRTMEINSLDHIPVMYLHDPNSPGLLSRCPLHVPVYARVSYENILIASVTRYTTEDEWCETPLIKHILSPGRVLLGPKPEHPYVVLAIPQPRQ